MSIKARKATTDCDILYLRENLNVSKPSEHPTSQGENSPNKRLRGNIVDCNEGHKLFFMGFDWVTQPTVVGKHRRRKVNKLCVTLLLCDPGWCVHQSDQK